QHTHYSIASFARVGLSNGASLLDGWLVAKVCVASVAFGLTSVLFAELTHRIQHFFQKTIHSPSLRPFVGGLVVIGLVHLVGSRDYLGLGVSPDPNSATGICIQSCFHSGGAAQWSWFWKLVFTAVTVGSGFKGGEVTPLFFIGAALGNVLAVVLGAPVDLLAGLGFVAVFAGATNTPLACTIMALELFTPGNGDLLRSGFVAYAAIACFLSYFLSGHSGIYPAQRSIEVLKCQ
ncbi:MAG: chloride channel protein, partial [Planctomycetota bacterium]|nr:chloride channel protein [Planctomycetota bacterium]